MEKARQKLSYIGGFYESLLPSLPFLVGCEIQTLREAI